MKSQGVFLIIYYRLEAHAARIATCAACVFTENEFAWLNFWLRRKYWNRWNHATAFNHVTGVLLSSLAHVIISLWRASLLCYYKFCGQLRPDLRLNTPNDRLTGERLNSSLHPQESVLDAYFAFFCKSHYFNYCPWDLPVCVFAGLYTQFNVDDIVETCLETVIISKFGLQRVNPILEYLLLLARR
jgi:hypothetical protein